jgi:hypothetical protein
MGLLLRNSTKSTTREDEPERMPLQGIGVGVIGDPNLGWELEP